MRSDGQPATSVVRTIADLGRRLRLVEAVATLDMALHRRLLELVHVSSWAGAHPRYRGVARLRRAIELGPEAIIREVNDAKLLGRGGAAFPTGRKWEAVARTAVRPHYLVCNADESEPGTFKDRLLMEEDPFALIEAMTIAGFATGCEQGYLYIRGEYPLAARRLIHAIVQARARGLLGAAVMAQGFRFEIELRRCLYLR